MATILPKKYEGTVDSGTTVSARAASLLDIAISLAVALAYALFKLLVTGVVQIYPHGLPADVPVPFFSVYTYRFDFYEPLWVWYPTRHLVIAISWWQALTTILFMLLVGSSVALLLRLIRVQRACRGCGVAAGLGLAGIVPSLLSGLVCCGAGWLGVVLGGAVAALPAFDLPLQFSSIALLAATLWYLARALHRAQRAQHRCVHAFPASDSAAGHEQL